MIVFLQLWFRCSLQDLNVANEAATEKMKGLQVELGEWSVSILFCSQEKNLIKTIIVSLF